MYNYVSEAIEIFSCSIYCFNNSKCNYKANVDYNASINILDAVETTVKSLLISEH